MSRITYFLLLVPSLLLSETFQESVRPLLEKHCILCHGEQLKMAELRLDIFQEEQEALKHPGVWEDVLRMTRTAKMPPPGSPMPSTEAIEALASWIESRRESMSSGLKLLPGRVTARRLNRVEYNNSIRDLLGVDLQPADTFPVDDSGYGFDNIGDVLSLSPLLMEKYLAAAGKIARITIWDRPRFARPTRYRIQAIRDASNPAAIGAVAAYMDDGSIQLCYEFPADGQYRMSFGATDRRLRTLNDSRYLSANELPPPRIMTMKLDGTRIGTKAIEATQDFDRSEKVSRQIEAGVKQVWLGFIDINGKPMNPNDEFQERRLWVDYLEINGPYDAAPKPTPESHNRIFICRPEGEEPWQPCAREILGQLADRAYRRPATHTELERLMKLASNSLRNGESFEEMVQYALQAILVSPQFLFRIERDSVPDDKEGIRSIDDYELASRLSYFLWSSMPDNELFDVARSGQLNEQAVLEQQVTRMLQNPKSSAFVENFSGQWLQLRNLSQANPDMEYFPEFDEQLREAMLKETQLYFETILHEDRSILEFLDSEFTYLNERLAQHYGINNIQGDKFQRVELQDGQRGGLLGQASILTISSYPTRTSPVLRGLWVLNNILGQRPPPPPPDVPELEVKEPEIGGTLREQLEMHRANEGCRSCHLVMDAIGFGLENYNPIGQWRIKDGDLPLDTSGTLPGELSFESPAELKRILMETEAESFGRTLTKKLMTYALGRGLNRDDNPAIGEIQQKLEEANYRFSALIQGIISSMPFQMRTLESLNSTASRSN